MAPDWKTSNAASGASAIAYIPESAWNDSALEGSLAAGGGGASTLFSKPPWQAGAGVPADGQRDVPDVALAASADHDGYLICSQGSCTKGFRSSKGTLDVVGGTSAGAPTFGGVLALVSQARGLARLGNANPALYALAATAPAAFHPIASGDNAVPCSAGSDDCPGAAPYQLGFAATGAYSLATGLGSVDAEKLAAAWPADPPPPSTGSSGGGATSSSGTSSGTSSGAGTTSGGTTASAPTAPAPGSPSSGAAGTATPPPGSSPSAAGSGGGGCSHGSAELASLWILALALRRRRR